MIRIHVPSGLPSEDRKLEFCLVELKYRRGATIADYLAELSLTPESVSHVIYNGGSLSPEKVARFKSRAPRLLRRVLRCWPFQYAVFQSDLELATPRDGDEFHVIPNVAGKNAAVILGVVGAVIGFATANPMLAGQGLRYAMYGYAIGSTIGGAVAALTAPKPPRVSAGDDAPTSYAWQGLENDDREGIPVPVLAGTRKVGIVRVSAFRRREANKEYLHILGLVSVGPINAIPLDTVKINEQPYTNFPGVTIETRLGTQGQQPLRGFNAVANTFAQNVELLVGGYTYSTRPNFPVDALELLLTLPAGVFHTPTTGNNAGQQQLNKTRYRYRYRLKGGTYGAWIDKYVAASFRGVIFETARIDKNYDGTPLTRGEYDVEIQWVSADFTNDATDSWKIFLTGVTEEQDELRTYDGFAMIAIRALAQQDLNGPMPNISLVPEGLLLETWNGSGFTAPAWSSGSEIIGRSPAWFVLKAMRDRSILNPTYDPAITDPGDPRSYEYSYEAWGAGDDISDDEIDLDSFITFANRAKELVTVKREDGTEYQEPRFLLDLCLNQEQRLLDFLNQILAECRAELLWSGNKWRINTLMPKDPVQVFSMGNILRPPEWPDLSITYAGDRITTALEAQFFDAERDWEWTTLPPIDGPGVKHYGQTRRTESRQFFGVTRRSQIIRESRYDLNKRWYLRRMIGFGSGTPALLAEAGDNILVQHDIPQWGFGGCALSGSTDSYVELGRLVEILAGKTYKIRVRFQDGSHDEGEERIVADGAGTYPGVYVTVPFSRAVQENDIYVFGEIVAKPFSIKAIEPIEDDDEDTDARWLTCLEYNESIENDDEVVTVPTYTALPNFQAPPPPIVALKVTEENAYRGDGSWPSTLIFEVTPPNPDASAGIYDYTEVERSWNGTDWEPFDEIGLRGQWEDAPHGATLWFRGRSVSKRGVKCATWTNATPYPITTSGKTTNPPVITGLVAAVEDGVFLFKCDPIPVTDIERKVQYEWRTSNPANWKTDTTGYLNRSDSPKLQIDDPVQRSYTIYVRAVDRFGNYSTGAANTTLTDSAPAAPSILSITRFKNQLKVKVGAAADSDVFALHLHSSQTSGFTPDDSTIVSGVVGPNGGEFVVPITASGTHFFKVTAEDWLSDRLNDWIYSSQASSSIIILSPVDPTGVTLAAANDTGRTGGVKNPDGTISPVLKHLATVGWSFNDVVNPANSLIGFEVIVYKSTDGVSKPQASKLIPDPTVRAHIFQDFQSEGGTYIGAVTAVYVDGLTSNLVTSTGQTITLPTNPSYRDSDDRNVSRLAESFDNGGLPTGFTVPIGTVTAVGSGTITIQTTASGAQLTWNLAAWIAAFMDYAASFGTVDAFAFIRVKFVGASYNTATPPRFDKVGNAYSLIPIMTDGDWHTYRRDIGQVITASDTLSLIVPSTFMPTGSTVTITAFGVAVESFDESLDGHLDRALRARDQFDKDPTGGGFFMRSPLRNADDSGQITLVDGNGVTWLRTGGGVEYPLKYAYKHVLSDVYDGLVINWDTLYAANPSVDPPVKKPSATNKARLIVDAVAPVQPNPLAYPVRRYAEITMVNDNSFQINVMEAYGGTKGFFRDVAPGIPGWNVAAKKSQILKDATHAFGSNGGNDAWYDFTTLSGGTLPNVGAAYYRVVAWLKATFPQQKKLNGSYYWVKLFLDAWAAAPNAGSNPLTLANAGLANQQISWKELSDGGEHRFPVVFAASTLGAMQTYAHALKFDWYSTLMETGAPGGAEPSALYLDAVEVYWMNSASYSPVTSTQGYNINLIAGEAF